MRNHLHRHEGPTVSNTIYCETLIWTWLHHGVEFYTTKNAFETNHLLDPQIIKKFYALYIETHCPPVTAILTHLNHAHVSPPHSPYQF
jgi:hypothetical protein